MGATYQVWIGRGADILEAIAVALIIGYILIATLEWLVRSLLQRRFTIEHYRVFRATLGRAMLLGLEILIAADVVRTVALEPTLGKFRRSRPAGRRSDLPQLVDRGWRSRVAGRGSRAGL